MPLLPTADSMATIEKPKRNFPLLSIGPVHFHLSAVGSYFFIFIQILIEQ